MAMITEAKKFVMILILLMVTMFGGTYLGDLLGFSDPTVPVIGVVAPVTMAVVMYLALRFYFKKKI